MIKIIPIASLGHQKHGWLNARHHFSFANYYDPRRMGQAPLRVWNDDTIKAGTGFPMHPHQDMEIITYIRTGAITHEDNLGNHGRTEAGNIQVMSAGSGIIHSEYNLENEATTLFQIWIETAHPGIEPRWATRPFPKLETDRLQLMASGRSEHEKLNALKIYQDAALWAANSAAGNVLTHILGLDRHAYLVASKGEITVNGISAETGDGVQVTNEEKLEIRMQTAGEIVMVDLPVLK